MNLERITLTPVTIVDWPGEVGQAVERLGTPISIRAKVKDISGSEVIEDRVVFDSAETEFEIRLVRAVEKITTRWKLRARGLDWEIRRALRKSAPGGSGNAYLVIRARVNR